VSLSTWFQKQSVSVAEVRAEIWRLGARHQGEPLQGALGELAERDISGERAALLRACVRKLRDA